MMAKKAAEAKKVKEKEEAS